MIVKQSSSGYQSRGRFVFPIRPSPTLTDLNSTVLMDTGSRCFLYPYR